MFGVVCAGECVVRAHVGPVAEAAVSPPGVSGAGH